MNEVELGEEGGGQRWLAAASSMMQLGRGISFPRAAAAVKRGLKEAADKNSGPRNTKCIRGNHIWG
jgi:hypothetical protein